MAYVYPVKSKSGRALVRDTAHKSGGWVSLFHDITAATGWRTNDVCHLIFDDIDFDTGYASIVVRKQTAAARTRAYMKAVKGVIADRMRTTDSDAEFRRLTTIDPIAFTDEMTAEELLRVEKARANAKVKRDRKRLPAHVLTRIKALQERDNANQWVFAKQFTESRNSGSLADGPISRQSVWKAFKKIGAVLKAAGVEVVRFSAYSLRKSMLYALYEAVKEKGGDGKAAARDFVGHSDIKVTEAYLALDQDETDEAQQLLFASEGLAAAA